MLTGGANTKEDRSSVGTKVVEQWLLFMENMFERNDKPQES